ncbi:protein kinase family protein [Saccharomonospora marina XMU15]|uniref:non-specific serine/threonine protein kinase n=1 Tax=Saccharomonospora marina XMU15 TaxID=882083 RepID=H5WWC8_9PSEU|nr:serine/threonine-protein kinase [Saccharomonospora marina]EHR49410.1 protein kinase family protein [Saccharomonospora marina XMU15]
MSEVGRLLAGRYRLRRRLGSGGMGVVWKAIDLRLQRPVAVKQLREQPDLDGTEEMRQRAMREGRIAAKLYHPNAIAVHDVVEDGGQPLLIMEYFPSRSLADILGQDGRLSAQEAASIGAQVAAALAEAHAAGILHRDVKPGNILVADDGLVKIGDFGISHAAGDVSVTHSGFVPGTPAYFAPEVARGRTPTTASDVFSLGATLYAVVEGAPPFGEDDDNSRTVLHRVAEGQFDEPVHAGPLKSLLLRMLAADPAERISAAQVKAEAQALVTGGRPAVELPRKAPAAAGSGEEPGTDPLAGSSAPTMPVRTEYVAAATGGKRRLSRRTLLYAAGALVVVAATTVFVISRPEQPNTVAQPQPTTPTPATSRPLTEQDVLQVVSNFYAALPEQPDLAWARLSPRMQAQGREQFDAYWSNVTDVTVVSPARVTDEKAVHIGVAITLRDGATVTEYHRFGVSKVDGTPRIDTDTLLDSRRVEPSAVSTGPAPDTEQTTSQAPPPPADGGGADDKPGRGNGNGHGRNPNG